MASAARIPAHALFNRLAKLVHYPLLSTDTAPWMRALAGTGMWQRAWPAGRTARPSA